MKEVFPKNIPGYPDLKLLAKDSANQSNEQLVLLLLYLSEEAGKAAANDLKKNRKKISYYLNQVAQELKHSSFLLKKYGKHRLNKKEITKVKNYTEMEKLAKDIFHLSYNSVTVFFKYLSIEMEEFSLRHEDSFGDIAAGFFEEIRIFISNATFNMERVWKICEKYTEEI